MSIKQEQPCGLEPILRKRVSGSDAKQIGQCSRDSGAEYQLIISVLDALRLNGVEMSVSSREKTRWCNDGSSPYAERERRKRTVVSYALRLGYMHCSSVRAFCLTSLSPEPGFQQQDPDCQHSGSVANDVGKGSPVEKKAPEVVVEKPARRLNPRQTADPDSNQVGIDSTSRHCFSAAAPSVHLRQRLQKGRNPQRFRPFLCHRSRPLHGLRASAARARA